MHRLRRGWRRVFALASGVVWAFVAAASDGSEAPCEGGAAWTFPAVAGWSIVEQPLRFTPENLYTFINGEAELYRPYGVAYAVFANYVQEGRDSRILNAEVFKLRSPLDAFGVYSLCRFRKAQPVTLGNAACLGSTQLAFFQGSYFGRVTAWEKSDESTHAMLASARTIVEALPEGVSPLPELDLLALEDVALETAKYAAKDLLGLPFLKNGLTAQAEVAGKAARVFVALGDSCDDAAARFSGCGRHGEGHGGGVTWEDRGDVRVGLLHDPKLEGAVFAQKGRFVVGVCDLDEPRAGLPLLHGLVENLSPLSDDPRPCHQPCTDEPPSK